MKEEEHTQPSSDGIVKRKIVQDIVPPEGGRRTIRDIPLPDNKAQSKKAPGEPPKTDAPQEAPRSRVDEVLLQKPRVPHKRDYSKFVLWGIVILVVIGLVFAVSSLFSGATVTLTPQQQSVTLNNTYTASTEGSGLTYQVIQISDTASRGVEATSEEYVETRASGTITIVNDHSSEPQILVERTRFETPDGKVYRIQEEVRVPGQSVVDGETVPGELDVTVYADEPGASFNIGMTDFTIPGFAGDPRFETFSAVSVTPMTGGFAGNRPVVDEATKTESTIALREQLRTRLQEELQNRVSAERIIPSNALFFEFESLPPTTSETGEVEVVEKATLSALALSESALARTMLDGSAAATDTIDIANRDAVSVTLEEKESFTLANQDTATIRVKGDASLIWVINEDDVTNAIAGKKKDQLATSLSAFTSIKEAEASIRPFWNRTFPQDVEDITVNIVLD